MSASSKLPGHRFDVGTEITWTTKAITVPQPGRIASFRVSASGDPMYRIKKADGATIDLMDKQVSPISNSSSSASYAAPAPSSSSAVASASSNNSASYAAPDEYVFNQFPHVTREKITEIITNQLLTPEEQFQQLSEEEDNARMNLLNEKLTNEELNNIYAKSPEEGKRRKRTRKSRKSRKSRKASRKSRR